MTERLEWHFPLPRTHTGIPLGNGRAGLLVWGSGNVLRITVARADLWDHRGGMPWTAKQNFRDIRACLEAGDADGIKTIFRPGTEGVPGQPSRPSVLPLGRLELSLADGWRLVRGYLALREGAVRIEYTDGDATKTLTIRLHPERDIATIRGTEDVDSITPVTSHDIMGDRLDELSFPRPERFPSGISPAGWYWALPADPGVYVAWKEPDNDSLVLAIGRAESSDAARKAATKATSAVGHERFEAECVAWWHRHWSRAAAISLPNPVLQEIHDYGLYLFAGLTNPSGIAATLQGPWIEEYDFPPWSSDYHFNINVQMCYSPAFGAGLLDHLKPLFDLVWSWRDRLAQNAKHFVGVDDGLMLPHAVDDRCTCMGSFWTGAIDHACTAWVAQMMFDYVDYSGDLTFLREVAFPFMRGTFVVYRAMMEEDGEALRLPVSVSPEYRGAEMNAWGANASFQLAAVHRLCENLIEASVILNEAPDARWREVLERLPKACVGKPSNPPAGSRAEGPRILLWEGVDLEESHRHHSHLAAIAPFDVIDPLAEPWQEVVERSLRHWVHRGMGMWSGWCMSWASRIHSRVKNGNAAELILELWRRVFTNEGRTSLHDASLAGFTLIGSPRIVPAAGDPAAGAPKPRRELMQMDGAMGGVAAVQEMLLHSRRGVVSLFPAIPAGWGEVSFERMRAPGGLSISGWYRAPGSWRIEIAASRATTARIEPPSATATLFRDGADTAETDGVIRLELGAGERVTIVSRLRRRSGAPS